MPPGLTEAARCHSKQMIERDYFSHTSKDGTGAGERVKRFYGWQTFGENIAWNSGQGEASVRRVMVQWMNSSGHRKNILSAKYREVGFGVVFGEYKGKRVAMFTADFGTRG